MHALIALQTSKELLVLTYQAFTILALEMSTSTTPSLTTRTFTSALLASPNHSRSLCRSRLSCALRTALACAFVGCSTLYVPESVRCRLSFPAFSYVTAVLIVGEATLGDALRGAVHAVYGTMLAVLPAALTLYWMRPAEFSVGTTSFAVGLSAFMVALPESTSLLTKRVALGQTVLVYAAGLKRDAQARAVLRPVHVAASTAVGVAAAVLALLFPYPRLACREAKDKSKQYYEMAIDRLMLLVDAFCADNSRQATASISQAKSLNAASSQLLQNIKLKQASIGWERPPFKFLTQQCWVTPNRLQAVETPLKGMEAALTSISSFPPRILDQEMKDCVLRLSDHISVALRQNSMTQMEVVNNIHQRLNIILQDPQDLPPYFFLFCMKLLLDRPQTMQSPNAAREKKVTPTTGQTENPCKEVSSTKRVKRRWAPNLSYDRIIVALKCSISLGLAILFGLLFNKDNGYWSGLIVAITMTTWREATFTLANVRAQGTALGSVYGVLVSVISQNRMEVRFLTLLPWIIFTSFLRHSQMYGQAGGIAATISAILILGRRNYGSPSAFAITRLAETFIGLSCSTCVELLLQPTRASTLARTELSRSLRTLNDCMLSLVLKPCASTLSKLREKEKQLREQVNELRKFIAEAELEPNFWFLPFPSDCYHKLHGSLCKMVELVLFLGYGMELLVQESPEQGAILNKIQEEINQDVELLKELVCYPLKCFEEIVQLESLSALGESQRKNTLDELELGKLPNTNGYGALSSDEEECEKAVTSLLQHTRDVVERIDSEAEGDLKAKIGMCLIAFGFCVGGLMKETRNMEKGILELVQRENPARHIDLYEISCVIKEVPT